MPMRPGDWCALGLVALALTMDAVLEHRGHDSISSCVRSRPVARRMVRWFDAHLTDSVWGDPLTLLGRVYATHVHHG